MQGSAFRHGLTQLFCLLHLCCSTDDASYFRSKPLHLHFSAISCSIYTGEGNTAGGCRLELFGKNQLLVCCTNGSNFLLTPYCQLC